MQAAPNSQMHRHLFSRFPKFTSHDAEEVRHQVSRIFCDHDLEFRMRHERNAEKLFIRVERSAFEQQCTQYYGHLAHGALHFNPAIHLQHASLQSLKRLLDWQLYEASEGDLFNQPLIAARFEEVLMVSLLGSLQHNQPTPTDVGHVAPGFVKRAEDYLKHHAHLPLTAGDIADHVGVSIRTLFAGFRKYRNTSPMRFLKQVRLEQVRQDLLHPTSDTAVTRVALSWGFTHLGQFSASYQQQFGELPSETLRRSGG
jgi:AraC-like DNA-binding protein